MHGYKNFHFFLCFKLHILKSYHLNFMLVILCQAEVDCQNCLSKECRYCFYESNMPKKIHLDSKVDFKRQFLWC